MPLKNYGVWVGYPISFVAEKKEQSPHLQLYADEVVNAENGRVRAAINIKSSTVEENRLVYWFGRNFADHPITDEIGSFEPGWHPLASTGLPALDFIRGNLIKLEKGTILRHDVPGENNDIIDYISPVLTEAINRKATIYLFGEQFPGGVHDIHMNQGNSGRFAKDNGIYQDGGILLHFPDDGHWEGVFLAFGVQKVHTDDVQGHPIGDVDLIRLIEGTVVTPITGEGAVAIRAALVNPVGSDPDSSGEKETVYLINKTKEDVNLDGWSIRNRTGGRQALSGVLTGQSEKGFLMPDCPLSNQGGTITVLDSTGLKVDGVSYSKEQARREGVLVYFN